jgi:hypothetical protein
LVAQAGCGAGRSNATDYRNCVRETPEKPDEQGRHVFVTYLPNRGVIRQHVLGRGHARHSYGQVGFDVGDFTGIHDWFLL